MPPAQRAYDFLLLHSTNTENRPEDPKLWPLECLNKGRVYAHVTPSAEEGQKKKSIFSRPLIRGGYTAFWPSLAGGLMCELEATSLDLQRILDKASVEEYTRGCGR
jgi:hypothetical protein